MDHKLYETWLFSDESLPPDQQVELDKHLESCEGCRQLKYAWQEVDGLFASSPIIGPRVGFADRWQLRLNENLALQRENEQRRSIWLFLASTTGAAVLVLIIMAIRFFSTIQNSTGIFISGMTFIAGLLNLSSAIRVAFFPLLEVAYLSIPAYWLYLFGITASLLTILLSISMIRILKTRRVSL
jgi:hypothetical protein